MPETYDFGGWATRNDLKCSDGRTIRRDAFKECDGITVPLVWHHQHDEPDNVLGHALLENRPEGVYAYGVFNDTEKGKIAKNLVQNGDIRNLSIYANNLKQKTGDVLHGAIREVSLVIAGANPGAYIDVPVLEHADGLTPDFDEADEAVIFTDEEIVVHSNEMDADPVEEEAIQHSETKGVNEMADNKEKTVQDVIDSMSDEQKQVMYFMVGQALEEKGGSAEKDKEDDTEMKHSVFDNDTRKGNYLSHDDMALIFKDAKRLGSLKEAVLQHSEDGVLAHDGDDTPARSYQTSASGGDWTAPTMGSSFDDSDGVPGVGYGIAGIDWLFPEARNLYGTPQIIDRRQDWVKVFMSGVHHTPFSRVKTMFADVTEDEARALGYMKGNRKKTEVFTLLRRSTDPQTIYKKQKLDRDDIVDITDFDVVAFVKGEMRGKLDEEIAGAALFTDGRLADSEDKISADHIRPVSIDDDLFTIKATYTATGDENEDPRQFIRQFIKARKNYRGSGNITMFITEDMLSDCLLMEDEIGHAMYADEAALARKLRVSRIVTVPDEIVARAGSNLEAVALDLNDYNMGADRGGSVNMFDDFDIDYNAYKYLIETRCSGSLVKPYAAIAVSKASGSSTPSEAESDSKG